jgi:hypothetical protein
MVTRAALEEERRGYVMRGLVDRVALVDAELAKLPEREPPVVLSDIPDNGGVPIDPNSSNVEAPTGPPPDVETVDEPKPSRRGGRTGGAAKPKVTK